MKDEDLKEKLNEENKEDIAIIEEAKLVMSRKIGKREFEINWSAQLIGDVTSERKEIIEYELYEFMKKYGIFFINSQRIINSNQQPCTN